MPDSLALFHPLIQHWFNTRYAKPTDIQSQAWPTIAAGEHLLITAPTGSGKTLTAFLWSINQLISGKWPAGQTSVLYISPLKALNNDIRRNLDQPLAEIQGVFAAAGEPFPQIRVVTRSGDTPQADRRRMVRHPPEIVITTPESLNLLLSSKAGRAILSSLSTVILDEIHAVVGEKRGTHLITAVDRLVRLAGDFQRIALSATVKPVAAIAEFVGGYRMTGQARSPVYTARPVSIVCSEIKKEYRVSVSFPETRICREIDDAVWSSLAAECQEIIQKNRATLIFANSRKLSEKLTFRINQAANQMVAYAHHGSLSRQIREEVERKLKKGDLKAIVATSSLEMGIDIGDLDEVVLIQTPPSISSAIQRIGRAGHHVGEVSKGTIFPSHAQDFISAAVLAEAIDRHDIEPVQPVKCPLDVLAQVIISMVCMETWDCDELFGWLKTSYPYHQLSKEQFDLVLMMLAGRYADSRIRELKPRIFLDRLDHTVAGKKAALMTVYMSGGTIPDRGYYQLRNQETGARIGELDEEYVWEAKIGQVATIGTQNWRIQRITHNDVFATPVGNPLINTPFWKSEEYGRDFHFSQQVSRFLEDASDRLDDPQFKADLAGRFHMNPAAIGELIPFLKRQKEHTSTDLPHRHHLLLEQVQSGPGGAPGSQLVIHTLWGGQLNRPFALALDAAWEERFGERLEIVSGNDSIVLQLPSAIKAEEILSLVKADTVETLLRKRLEGSGFFAARFRECAGRALLITRNRINQRMPLWMTRLRSQKLMESVLKYDDFPILLETWRTCLQDEFDLENLRQMLTELETGSICWSVSHTGNPSPFAAGSTWNQINKYMYQTDQPASTPSALRNSLLQDVVFTPELRPAIPSEIICSFETKRQRLAPGYSPQSPSELVDWLKERILLPLAEWESLQQAILSDSDRNETILAEAAAKLVILMPDSASSPLIASLEYLPRILSSLYPDSTGVTVTTLKGTEIAAPAAPPLEEDQSSTLLAEWLSFYGPKSRDFISATLGLDKTLLTRLLEEMVEDRLLIVGNLVIAGNEDDLCDAENFESLLRLTRAGARPEFKALPAERLPLFVAHIQGLTRPALTLDELFQKIEQLVCLPCPADAWETDIFPTRMLNYQTSLLDSVMQEGDLRWLGVDNQKVAFCFESDLELMLPHHPQPAKESIGSRLEGLNGRYNFAAIQQLTGQTPTDLSRQIWQEVWKGWITNDSYAALRKGINSRFVYKPSIASEPAQRRRGRRISGRSGFSQWKESLPYAGNWFSLPIVETPGDLLEQEELNKDRTRLLLDRYGILFRELLQKELPEFSWRSIFRSLRLMELSGEILSGYFFETIPGPQFISHQAFRTLRERLPHDAIYWMSATDPASLCGLQVDTVKRILPRRLQSTHLVFQGDHLVLISEAQGKRLTINAAPDDENIERFLAPLKHLLYRQFMPLKQVAVETINQSPAATSPFVDAFKVMFDVLVEFKKITLYRKL